MVLGISRTDVGDEDFSVSAFVSAPTALPESAVCSFDAGENMVCPCVLLACCSLDVVKRVHLITKHQGRSSRNR